jgi:putative chitinase
VSQLKNDLKLDQFEMQNFAKNVAVNWEAINTIEKDGLTIYEIPISEINQTTIASNLFQEQLKYGLIAIKKAGEMHSYLIEAYSSVNHSLYANAIENLSQFTGTLNVYELNGDLINQLVVFNGKSTNPSSNSNLAPLDEAINLFYKSKSITSRVPSCNITQFVPIIYQREERHYVPTVIVGTYTNWGYSYSTFTLTTTRTYMSVPYPCGTDADYHHVPYMVTTYEDLYDECPVGQVKNSKNECVTPCDTKKEDLKKVFPNTDDSKLQEIADAINKYGKDFGIDTKEKLQHFLAQAGHESADFKTFEEYTNFQVKRLHLIFSVHFNPYDNPTKDPNKQNPKDYEVSGSMYAKTEKLYNFVYNDANRGQKYKLGNTSTGDGYKYRGRGIFQLTGKYNYQIFSNFYNNNYDSTINLVANPELVSSNKTIAVISALWYYKNIVSIEIDSNTTVEELTYEINGEDNGLDDREQKFEKAKNNINCI